MNGEWQRRSPPVRLPWRPTDRVEEVAAWVLTILGVLTALLAVTTGVRLHDEGMHRIRLETRGRMQVQAVLLEPANPNAGGERTLGVRVVAVPRSIRYLAPDGTERVTDVPVTGAEHPGRAVPLCVDRSGQVVGAPGHTADAVGRAAVGALGIALIGTLILGGSWAGVRAATRRVNMARWEREWMLVEPRWSGRTRS